MRKLIQLCFLILLAGCGLQVGNPPGGASLSGNSIKDGGFISKSPCGPPCFHGIIPGTTTDMEVNNLMNSLTNIFTNCKAFDLVASGGKRGIDCDYVDIGYSDHRVYVVGFRPSERISIQQIIDLYGPPNSVYVSIVSLPDNPDRSSMTLYFDQIQTMLGPADQDGNRFIINSDTVITSVTYLSTSEYLESKSYAGNLQWQGYGSYIATR